MNRREAIQRATWLTGAGILTPGILAILQSCQNGPSDLDWVPQVLAKDQAIRLNLLSDIIVPETESPSATNVHVPEFMDLLMADVLSEEQNMSITEGLQTLGDASRAHHGQVFEDLSAEEHLTLITSIDDAAFSEEASVVLDQTFLANYRYIKSLILMAYYTSEEGVKQNLNYMVIPGEYQACIDLPKDGKVTVGNHM